jgi:hypothetical protein
MMDNSMKPWPSATRMIDLPSVMLQQQQQQLLLHQRQYCFNLKLSRHKINNLLFNNLSSLATHTPNSCFLGQRNAGVTDYNLFMTLILLVSYSVVEMCVTHGALQSCFKRGLHLI